MAVFDVLETYGIYLVVHLVLVSIPLTLILQVSTVLLKKENIVMLLLMNVNEDTVA